MTVLAVLVAQDLGWTPAVAQGVQAVITVLFGAALFVTLRRQAHQQLQADVGRAAANHSAAAKQEAALYQQSQVASRTANAVIITDALGKITWVNDAFTRITGYSADEARGRTPGSFLQGPNTDRTMVEAMRRGIMLGVGFHVEVLNYGKHGGSYWLDIEALPLRDANGVVSGFMATEIDITARKQVEAELQRQTNLLRETQRASGVGGWEVDARTSAIYWTMETHRIHETDPAVFVPTMDQAIHFYHPESIPQISAAVEQGMRYGTPWDLQLRFITATKRVIWVRAIGQAEREGDRVVKLFGSFQDITEQVTARNFLESSNRQLAEAATRAESADRAKSAFLAMMSHEIRTPMNGVLGSCELLALTTLELDQLQHVETIKASGSALLTLIEDILDFSKIEAGRLELDVRPCNFKRIIQDAMIVVQGRAEAKGLRIHLDIGVGVPEHIFADDGRIRQVLLNLLSNAVKFSSLGDIHLRVEVQPTSDACVPVILSVIDSGIGIATADQARLFQAFVQVEGARTTRAYGGTGLGLAICKRLCDLMGGEISVSSQLGVGSTFSVRLPLAIDSSGAVAEIGCLAGLRRISAQTQTLAHTHTRVLVVEDNPMNLHVARMLVEHLGHHVTLAEHGQRAVDLAAGTRFDVILMDCMMPVLDGFEATRQIRIKGGLNESTPIIAVSASVSTDEQSACRRAGMNAFLGKPYSHMALGTLLEQWIIPDSTQN